MSRHTPVERLPSGLFFTANFARQPRAVEPEEVNPTGGAPKKIVYREAPTTKPSVFAHFSSVTPKGPLPATEDHESPCSSRSSSIGEPDQAPTSLPLLNVSVEVNVEGFIAHTTLVQRFNNPSDETITQARYTFPLYDGAVVTSFRCTIGNERVLQGKVEPKKEARRKYKEAVEKKEVAALLEEHTPEVFETVVGNIPAKTAVKVNITYVNELRAATGQLLTEGLSVILPTSIAPRYSRGPKKYRVVNNLKNEGLDITITVHDDDGHVKDIISESGHNIVLEKKAVARPPQVITDLDNLGDDDPRAPTDVNILQATYHSTTPVLQGDFIAIIQMQDGWPLRSRAALSITDKNGHAALMANIKPSEVFSSAVQTKTFNGEIVFVVDQSGSMSGAKIRTLRSALPLSLTSLPLNCAVNIVSFGSHTQFRWPTSQKYSAEVLKSAKEYASSFQAVMGGTELLFALQEVVKSRLQDRSSMQIIVITDGEVEPEKIIRFVWQTRQELGDRVRFFALGIGNQVSHQLIECIGEFGGGYGETADIQKVPKWEKKLIRMLKGAMMPNSWSCEIDLGPRFERRDSTTYDLSEQPPQAQDRIPYIQAPFPTPSLHPFRYQALYFLVDMKAFDERLRKQKLLGEIILSPHAEADKTSEFPLKLDIGSRNTDTIHQLTAKAILGQLEAELDRSPVSEAQRDLAQVNGEYLGTTYSIASKWTSFVAVDKVTQEADEIDFYKANIKTVDHEDDPPEDSDSLIQTATNATKTYWEPSPRLAAQTEGLVQCSELDVIRALSYSTSSVSNLAFSLKESKSAGRWTAARKNLWALAKNSKSQSKRRSSSLYGDRESRITRIYGDISRYSVSSSSGSADRMAMEAAEVRPIFRGCGTGIATAGFMNASLLSYSDDVDGPILLQKAVATQDVTGIFEIDEPLRERLELHFCPRTLETLLDAISGAVPSETLTTVTDIKALGYTMMLVHYIRTHLAQDQELWDLMVQKARDAVQQALTLKDDSLLVSLDQLLEKASMHAHFRPTVDWSDVAQLVPFPPTSVSEACPACGKTCDKTPASSFKCTFPGCNVLSSGWSSWDELWKHQVENGHLVCHQKKSLALARNEQHQEKRREEKGERGLVQAKEEKRHQQTVKTAKTKRSFWDILLRRSK